MNWRDERDHTLVNWARDLNQFAEEGVEPLSPMAIERAEKLSAILRQVGSPVFTLMPDANGGIVFEYKRGGLHYVYNVWEDGSMSVSIFNDTHLIETFNG